jgi:chromate transport protein ChrA
VTVLKLFLLVVSLAAVAFGGGAPISAGLERALVPTGVITPDQFAAGMALGQSTPGPLASFTTAIGNAALGFPGAVAATLGLVVVSLCTTALIRRVPAPWFDAAPVRAAVGVVAPYVAALSFFLAWRVVQAGNHSRLLVPGLITGAVMAGRLLKLPPVLLILGAVGTGMLLQGSSLVGW